MIEFIKGMLFSKELGHAVVETEGGVGYGMDISLATFESLPEKGESCFVHTLLYVREDAFRMYGFSTVEEREIFEVLLGTSGIGPKLALSILSNMPINEFAAAIASRNIALLKTIPAIGKKTAERLCVELQGKLQSFQKTQGKESPGETGGALSGGKANDAVSALVALGVKPGVAAMAIRKAMQVLGNDAPVEDLVKEGLKHRR